MNKFNVTITLSNGNEATTLNGTVEFHYCPDTYGNGYTMVITGLGEPWKEQGYDIRYDKTFNKANPIPYIVEFYADRYTGKNGAWLLIGISVTESEI